MRIDRYDLFSLLKVFCIIALVVGFFMGLGVLTNFYFSGSTTAMAIILVAWRGWQNFKTGRPWLKMRPW